MTVKSVKTGNSASLAVGNTSAAKPEAPTIGTATTVDSESVTVTYTAAIKGAAGTTFTATSNPSSITGTGASPITVSGLAGSTSYTFTVKATNANGDSAASAASNSTTTNAGIRGLFAGGLGATKTNVIDYITMASLGNAIDFGDLGLATNLSQGGGSSTRGVFVRGYTGTSPEISSTVMDYVTIATTGNATEFGNRTVGAGSGASTSNATTMVSVSYAVANNWTNDYITIATTGNSTSWGATWNSNAGDENACTASSSTRGLFVGGYRNGGFGPTKQIQYITYATTGSISFFGDLQNIGYSGRGGTSNGVRAVFKNDFSNVTLDYVTIATTGNASDFGDLSFSDYNLSAGDCSNGTRGVFAGGRSENNVIQYITINTTGNTSDFGDLTVGRNGPAATSSGHGGL